MPRAIIVVGNELRFLRAADRFRAHLVEVGVDPIRVLYAAYRDGEQLYGDVVTQILSAVGSPLLLAYFGHGLPIGWAHTVESPVETVRLEYARLAPMLARRKSSTLVLNECCYAGALVGALEDAKADQKLVSLIAASQADQPSYPGMAERVVESWRGGRIHEPFVETTALSTPLPLRVRLGIWLYQRKIGLKARFFPRKYPIPLLKAPVVQTQEVRWGTPIDHLFLKKP